MEESYICSKKCWGVDNYDGSCCCVENRDFIIGTHLDTDDFIENLSLKLNRDFKKEEIFIEYEEGKNIFPDKSNWQNPKCYPALRIELENIRKNCIFYNNTLKFCSVYDIRPETCQNYKCDYLKKL